MPGPPIPIPEDVSIGSAYGIRLEGIFQTPDGEGRTGVVLCHPHPALGGTMRTPLVTRMATGIVRTGRPVLRFNFRGVGGSEGAQTGGELEPLDVAAATAWLRARLGRTRTALVGWSFGSLMALAHARTDDALAAVVAVAPPLGAMDPPAGVEGLGVPLLCIAGDRDPISPAGELGRLPGEHVVVPGANHFFWGKEDALIAELVAFLDRTTGD